MRGLNVERLIIAAMSLGAARRSLQDTIAYVRSREQFGRRSAISGRPSSVGGPGGRDRMLPRIRLSGGRTDRRGLEDQLAREGRSRNSNAPRWPNSPPRGMQLMGGNGYTVEFGMEAQVRKALAPPIYGGANEIQREIIGKSLGS